MGRIYEIKDGIPIADITATNLLINGGDRFKTNEVIEFHESGAALHVIEKNKIKDRKVKDLEADPKYIEWMEKQRRQDVLSEIRKKFLPDEEISILRNAIKNLSDGNPVGSEFEDYNTEVENITNM